MGCPLPFTQDPSENLLENSRPRLWEQAVLRTEQHWHRAQWRPQRPLQPQMAEKRPWHNLQLICYDLFMLLELVRWKISFWNKTALVIFKVTKNKHERRDFYDALSEITKAELYQYTNKCKLSCYHKPIDRPVPKSCSSWRYKESVQLFQVSSAEGCVCPFCLFRETKSHSHYFHNYLNNAAIKKKTKQTPKKPKPTNRTPPAISILID